MPKMFPSPLGVSYFQISLKVCKRCLLLLKKFPSPLGVSYFQMTILVLIMRSDNMVSVPSRGILFPNKKIMVIGVGWKFPSPLGVSYFQIVVKAATCTEEGTVSVPSRGILFPNIIKRSVMHFSLPFPSPLGVSYFQMHWRSA